MSIATPSIRRRSRRLPRRLLRPVASSSMRASSDHLLKATTRDLGFMRLAQRPYVSRACGSTALDVRVLEGPLSAASALKMSYAGINKGTQAIGAAMMLAAMRAGSADALFEELSFSQKEILAQFRQQLPKMPAKAYRWIAEMQEIAGFIGDDPAGRKLYEGAAHFYEKMAEDFSGDQKAADALERFLSNEAKR